MLKAISTITNALGALNYKGTWNASSNTPALADGTGAKGDYYVTSTAGTQTFGGIQLFFGIGDWIVYNGAVWQRVEGGSDGNFANVTMTSTDAGAAAAPLLDLYRDSATPAASDTLGEIEFNGEDSAGNKQQYAVIHGSILSPTSTAESGQLHFETATAGASTEKMIIGTSNLVINDIGGIFNVRIEGDTDANLLFTDATNDRVGVGTISPSTKLQVAGTVTATGVADSALTSGRVTFAGSGGLLTDSANFTFDGSNLYASGKVGATNLDVGTSSAFSCFYVITARGTTGSLATKTVTISGFTVDANEAYSCEVNVSLIITGNVGNSGAKFLVQGSIGSANSTNYTVTELVRFNNAGSGGGPLSTISAITKAVGSFSFTLANGSGGQNGVYGISVQNTAQSSANCVTIEVT